MARYRPLVAVPELGAGMICAEDVRAPLLDWRAAVLKRGGKFTVNSLTRTAAEQQKLRDRYVNWLNAGKPNPAVAAANKPGRSNHQGGRALDIQTGGAFPNAPADKQVDLLWETGKPLGWTPIIGEPDESKSERWHFDFWGEWLQVKVRLGYETGCLCSALDVGQAGEWQSDARLLQALLLRAGFDIGEPDGILGKRSMQGLQMALGTDKLPVLELVDLLRLLPCAATWKTVPRPA